MNNIYILYQDKEGHLVLKCTKGEEERRNTTYI